LFGLLGEGLTKHYFAEVILTLGKVPFCKYGTPSTNELALSLDPQIDYAWAFILENHGALTLGTNLDDAYNKMEKLEHAAEIIYKARLLGTPNELSPEKVNHLLEISEETYGIKQDRRNVF
jgi:L-fuculose-phosphate aldolase